MKRNLKKRSIALLISLLLYLGLANIAYSVTWPNTAGGGRTYPNGLSSDYGPRTGYTYHEGLDFPDDKNIKAVEAGKVDTISGELIIIQGSHTVRYFHMDVLSEIKDAYKKWKDGGKKPEDAVKVTEDQKIGEYQSDHVDIKLSTFTNPLRDLFSSLYTGSAPSIKYLKLPDIEFKEGKYYIDRNKVSKATIESKIETTTKDLDTVEFSFTPSISGFPIKFDYHNWNLTTGMRWDSICNKADPAKDTFYYDWEIPNDIEDGTYTLKVTAKTVKGEESSKEVTVVIENAQFIVTTHPAWQNFTKPNESHTHYITITNQSKKKSYTANIKMQLIKASSCLSITQYPETTLEIPANSAKSTTFVVTSGEELKPDDNLIHQIIVEIEGVKASAIQYANGQNVITDHPDESYDISDPRYPTPAKIDSEAEVGVYLNGFVDGVAHLLGRFNEPVWFIDQDFVPLPTEITSEAQGSPQQVEDSSQETEATHHVLKSLQAAINKRSPSQTQQQVSQNQRKLSDFKVLVIPSYGLSGVDTSDILKWKLREYVKQGGVVVCWTQKYGEEFGFLPGTLTGYGANEDQSCWRNAAYIDEYHPIMAGQDSVTLDCNADGYFTQWGEAKVILRRGKNQQPALVMYPYGQGWVVAGGLYPDWGYGHGQWSQDEVALVRDLIAWAKQPTLEMPETRPNGTISLSARLQNIGAQIAEKVAIKIIDPERKSLPSSTLDLTPTLGPNQTRELTLDSSLIPSLSSLTKLGIYEMKPGTAPIFY